MLATDPQLDATTNFGGAMMFQARKIVSALVLVLGACLPLAAQQAGGTKVGVLTCRTSASLGLIVGSHKNCDAVSDPIMARRKTMSVTLTG
jgi:hypothetical protein